MVLIEIHPTGTDQNLVIHRHSTVKFFSHLCNRPRCEKRESLTYLSPSLGGIFIWWFRVICFQTFKEKYKRSQMARIWKGKSGNLMYNHIAEFHLGKVIVTIDEILGNKKLTTVWVNFEFHNLYNISQYMVSSTIASKNYFRKTNPNFRNNKLIIHDIILMKFG